MGTPQLLSASINSLTGSDNATGSIYVHFSEALKETPATLLTNYNFSPDLTIVSASQILTPEVWFEMNENAGTSITSSNGLYSGSFEVGSTALSWETGSYSTGSYNLFFDGTADRVIPPVSAWSTTNEVTIAFWTRVGSEGTTVAGEQSPFSAYNSSNQRVYQGWVTWQGRLIWDCGYKGPGAHTADRIEFDWPASSFANSTKWHHLAFTKNVTDGGMLIYIDGQQVSSGSSKTAALDTILTSRIGCYYNDTYDYYGNLSDFAIWNVELSASDIGTLFNSSTGSSPGSISSSNLTVYYPFQEGDGTTAYDKSGYDRDGAITNSNWALSDPTPQPRTWVKFPRDNNSYIDCGHHPNFGTGSDAGPFSVSSWVKWNNTPVSNEVILSANNGSTTAWYATNGWGLYFYSNSLRFQVQNNSNQAIGTLTTADAVESWNHVVGTWDNSTIKIYINGVLGGTTDSYSGDMTFDDNPLLIGAGSNTAFAFNAIVNDVRIYPGKALTQTEVTALYNNRIYHINPKITDLTVTGLDQSQGYILDVNNNVVSADGGLACVPNSASFIGAVSRGISNDVSIFKGPGDGVNRTHGEIERKYGSISNLSAAPIRTVIEPGTLTIKYFQRVYDAGGSQWCYYTKTTIDPTPASGETEPSYVGPISNHSVVKILEIY